MNLKSERDLGSDFSKKAFGKSDSTDTIYQNYLKQMARHHFLVKNIIQVIINKKMSVNIVACVGLIWLCLLLCPLTRLIEVGCICYEFFRCLRCISVIFACCL